ncbi:MAG: insulinase family protein, partial [Bacteroidetes bacterium]|nr:insulinase family protein [Bacteroidota bacterium]
MNRFARTLVLTLAACLLTGAFMAPSAAAQDPIRTADYDVENLDFPPLGDFEAPEPERLTLDNGMTIFLLEDHELPQVNAVARIGVGSVYEPAAKVGLASVTGTVMRTGGTASMSSDSINQVLEGLGATVETSIGTASGSAFMSTLKENVDTVLPIFAEVLRRPAFAAEKVNLAKNQQKSAISRRNDNPQQIALREFDKIVYGEDSPYARHTEYWTVDAITREDVVNFYDQYFEPNNVILSVWGDFDAEAMEEQLRAQFGDWTAPEDFTPPMPPEPTTNRAYSVNFVQKDDVTQSTILMGHPGALRQNDPDYPAVTVMNEVLSGGFSGRLFQNVRSDQGLAYSVFGNYSAGYNRPGRFFAGVFTKSGTTVEATNAVMREVEKMRAEPPSEDEMQLAKDSYLNSFVFNYDTKREVLSRLMTYAYYDYPSNFLQQVRDGVEQVAADDVLRVSQEYLYPDQSHILVVGRQQDFSQDLSTLTKDGAVNAIDVSIPQRPPGEAAPAASAEDMAAGRELAMAARAALGGDAFEQVENMRVVTQQQGNTSTLVVRLPNQLRTALSTPMGELTVVDDGEAMQLKTPQGTQTAPPQMRSQINGQLWRT